MTRLSILAGLFLLVLSPAAQASEVDTHVFPTTTLRLGLPDLLSDTATTGARAEPASPKGKSPPKDRVFVGTAPVRGRGASPMGKPFGLGIELGAPTSLTLKYMLTPDQGLVVGLGAYAGFLFAPTTVSAYVDYLWHPHTLVRTPPFRLTWYVGGGLWTILGTGGNLTQVPGTYLYLGGPVGLAARVPIGLNLALNELPIEFYLQATPALLVLPGVGLSIGSSLGFRFYF